MNDHAYAYTHIRMFVYYGRTLERTHARTHAQFTKLCLIEVFQLALSFYCPKTNTESLFILYYVVNDHAYACTHVRMFVYYGRTLTRMHARTHARTHACTHARITKLCLIEIFQLALLLLSKNQH